MRLQRRPRSRGRNGSVIVEFALIVPFLFIIVFGVIDFSRAYSQLNAMNAGLREGARYASVLRESDLAGDPTAAVRAKVQQTAAVFGYNSVDPNLITLTYSPAPPAATEFVIVTVTAHPVPLPVLGRFLGISPFTVTRSVRYRWERTGA